MVEWKTIKELRFFFICVFLILLNLLFSFVLLANECKDE